MCVVKTLGFVMKGEPIYARVLYMVCEHALYCNMRVYVHQMTQKRMLDKMILKTQK